MGNIIYCRKCNKKYNNENIICCGRKVFVYDETNEYLGKFIKSGEQKEMEVK